MPAPPRPAFGRPAVFLPFRTRPPQCRRHVSHDFARDMILHPTRHFYSPPGTSIPPISPLRQLPGQVYGVRSPEFLEVRVSRPPDPSPSAGPSPPTPASQPAATPPLPTRLIWFIHQHPRPGAPPVPLLGVLAGEPPERPKPAVLTGRAPAAPHRDTSVLETIAPAGHGI